MKKLGLSIYLLSTPTNDYWGGFRLGENLFAESIVALDIETGERIWHFQTVHHGVWDYDVASAPNLVDIEVDGKAIKAIAQVSKTAFTYVFDRITGEPVWPIEERPVAQSDIPGERLHPTQPFPTKPAPFDRQGISEDDLIDFTPEIAEAAREMAQEYVLGPIFTPPIVRGSNGKRSTLRRSRRWRRCEFSRSNSRSGNRNYLYPFGYLTSWYGTSCSSRGDF